MRTKRNFFSTLNNALEAERLLHTWDGMRMPSIEYGETRYYHFDDDTRYGRAISIYRDERGLYERPVHYSCN